MEPISKRSRIETNEFTSAIEVPATRMCFKSYHDSKVWPTSPPNENSRQFAFQILPQNAHELYPPACKLEITFKLTKADGSAIEATDQVGCINGIGI